MAKLPTYEEIGKKVAEEALDRYIYKGKTLREWIDILAQTKWIPVSERLPEVADCYAVTRQIGSDLIVDACFFDGTNTWHNDNRINHERNYLTDIIAWMPLPQPYIAESEAQE